MTNNNKRKMKRKKRHPLNLFGGVPLKKKKIKQLVPKDFFVVKPFSKSSKKTSGLINSSKGKMKLFTPVKMKPTSFLIKESINQKRKLNDWGDADLDGSPNKFDCNPRNPAEDGALARALGILTGGRYGQSAKEFADERADKKISKIAVQAISVKKEDSEAFQARKKLRRLANQRIKEIAIGEGIEFTKEQREKLTRKASDVLKEEQQRNIEKFDTINPTKGQRAVAVIKGLGVAPLLEKGLQKSELKKEIKSLQSQGKSTVKQREQLARIQKETEQKRKRLVGGILTTLTPLGAVPEIRRLTKTKSTTTQQKGRGRPEGPSGKYVVDGEAVSEANFQQVRAIENKKRKAMGMAKVPTGSLQLNTIKQAVSRTETPQAVQEGEVFEEEVEQQPTRRQMTTQEMQAQEQRDDNILHAPNFQKGELQQTAGVFREDPKFNILNAPNFQKGGLRNVGQTEEKAIVSVGERPNPNPYGEEYTDIDPGSGRTIVQRRPQEKWATGEAL